MADPTDAELDQLINNLGLRPRKGPGARAACGTPSGYERHRNNGEDACDDCRKANTDYKTAQFRRPVVAPGKLKPIAHGTPRGAKQHRYRGEKPCQPCREAENAYQRGRVATRRAGGAK